MKIKAIRKGVLPRNWKNIGITYDAWKELNNGNTISVSKVPSDYETLVIVVEEKTATNKPTGKVGK